MWPHIILLLLYLTVPTCTWTNIFKNIIFLFFCLKLPGRKKKKKIIVSSSFSSFSWLPAVPVALPYPP